MDIILDTDIGVDCDDAAALALVLNMQKKGLCHLSAITACTTREGATSAVRALCEYYGFSNISTARSYKPLQCDAENVYAERAMYKYGFSDCDAEAVSLLRRTLSAADNKVCLIGIGPCVNLCNLLKSGSDEISPLSGAELIKEKVSRLYLMAGCFDYGNNGSFAEWNVACDIESAKYVVENFPCEIVFCPFEIGKKIKTKIGDSKNPAWFAMAEFAKYHGHDKNGFTRESWDPVTCMLPFENFSHLFEYSERGTVTVTDKGVTVFTPAECGKHRYVISCVDYSEVETLLNNSIE